MSDGTVTRTGADLWFSSDGPDDSGPSGWRLDVVTLLAVIGESSIAEHSQAITASIICLLPRIIPAPQALLKSSRPARMPGTPAKTTGVHSGVTLDSVGFFANILHPLDDYKPFGFRVLRITHKDNEAGDVVVRQQPQANANGTIGKLFGREKRTNTNMSNRSHGLPRPPKEDESDTAGVKTTGVSFGADVEAQAPTQGITRRQTVKDRMTDYMSNPTLADTSKRPAVPAALWSPVHIISALSFLLTLCIIGAAAHWRDGTAILAVTLVSLASSVVGAASWWRPILMKRSHTNKVPDGDVVIRTREGAFILIKCSENVARELYAGTEECEYRVGPRVYSALMGLGTFLLMISVILLGNCKWNTQIFIGASYITLNGLYWAMALLPKRLFWDLSRYHVDDQTPEDARNAHETTDTNDQREGVPSFTRTLWYCIRETKRTAWVERSGAAPSTPQWRAWLAEAERAAEAGEMAWPAIARKDELMRMSERDIDLSLQRSPVDHRGIAPSDPAEQAVPATEVQPRNPVREAGRL